MKPTYRIKDWEEHFETAESRKLKATRWVPMPTKHDGKGFRRITQHPDGTAIFCAWNLIVQVASKMPIRGVLADNDGPLDAEDLAAKTGFSSAIFESALPFLSSERIGWITLEDQQAKTVSAAARQNPPELAVTPVLKGREGKGIEKKGREKKKKNSAVVLEPPFESSEFRDALADYEQHRKEKRNTLTPTGRKQLYRDFREWGEERSIAAIRYSISKGWTGVFERNGKSATQEEDWFKPPPTPEMSAREFAHATGMKLEDAEALWAEGYRNG